MEDVLCICGGSKAILSKLLSVDTLLCAKLSESAILLQNPAIDIMKIGINLALENWGAAIFGIMDLLFPKEQITFKN